MDIQIDNLGKTKFDTTTGDFKKVTGINEAIQHAYVVLRAEKSNNICKAANLQRFIGAVITEQLLTKIKRETEIALNENSPISPGMYTVAVSLDSPSEISLRIYIVNGNSVDIVATTYFNVASGSIIISPTGTNASSFSGVPVNTLASRVARRSRT